MSDGHNAGFGIGQAVPDMINAVPQWGNDAKSGDNNTLHEQLFSTFMQVAIKRNLGI